MSNPHTIVKISSRPTTVTAIVQQQLKSRSCSNITKSPRKKERGHDSCAYRNRAYLVDGRELEVRVELAQLLVGGGLLELAIALGGVEHDVALEVHRLCEWTEWEKRSA
jgi:hypothetical protein